jgi:hypothetical protein
VECLAGAYTLSGYSVGITYTSNAQTVTGGPGRRSRRVYVEQDGEILVFPNATHAASYIAAQKEAEKVEQEPAKVVQLRQKPKQKPKQPETVIRIDVLEVLAAKFAVPVDTALETHDYDRLTAIYHHLMMLQDEEDVELLLLAA